MKPAPPAPTLEQLRRGHPWCWVVYQRCLHRRPVAFVPLIIRWGADAFAGRHAAPSAAARAQPCSTQAVAAWIWGVYVRDVKLRN
jgi:hypothetical protein